MKRVLVTVAVLVAALASGGCATTASKPHTAASVAKYDSDVDYSKVVSVNRWATMRGYGVEWVNLPRKSKGLKDKDD
jgi:outer membrane lipoprotein SlyB